MKPTSGVGYITMPSVDTPETTMVYYTSQLSGYVHAHSDPVAQFKLTKQAFPIESTVGDMVKTLVSLLPPLWSGNVQYLIAGRPANQLDATLLRTVAEHGKVVCTLQPRVIPVGFVLGKPNATPCCLKYVMAEYGAAHCDIIRAAMQLHGYPSGRSASPFQLVHYPKAAWRKDTIKCHTNADQHAHKHFYGHTYTPGHWCQSGVYALESALTSASLC